MSKNIIAILSALLGLSGFIFALGTAGMSDLGLITGTTETIRVIISLLMLGSSYLGLKLTLN